MCQCLVSRRKALTLNEEDSGSERLLPLFDTLPKYCNSRSRTVDRTQVFPDRKQGYIFSGNVLSETLILLFVCSIETYYVLVFSITEVLI
jgi:hypothetical protein